MSNLFSSEEFKNPGSAWRGKPFWSWNGKLEAKELLRQIHIMKEMGFGGYFMHSRTGLATKYLGKEWFELINLCAEEGKKLGMESWLYDEDRWPSGTAGGMVTENPEYQMKYIGMQILSAEELTDSPEEKSKGIFLGAWSCRIENEIDIYDLVPYSSADSITENKSVLIFDVRPMAPDPFYNGNTYVDTMKRTATDEFIRQTHDAYKQHCGHHFGKAIKGIFTDEPHRGAMMSGFGNEGHPDINPLCQVPWTDAIFERFEKEDLFQWLMTDINKGNWNQAEVKVA